MKTTRIAVGQRRVEIVTVESMTRPKLRQPLSHRLTAIMMMAMPMTMIISIPYRIAFYITCSPVFMMGIHPRETIHLLGFGKRNGPVLCLRLLRVKNTTWSNLVKLYVHKYLVDETRFHFR